jgi:hypoxia up-regulated 1
VQFRLRDYLAEKFNDMKKTKTDVRSVPRAMAKLLKEAARVKTVLSANAQMYSQVQPKLLQFFYIW